VPKLLFYQSAFSKFLFELFIGGGKFGSPLHDPLVKFACELLLIAQKPCLLKPDGCLIRRYAQKKSFRLLREVSSLSSHYDYAEFALQPKWQRHDRNISLTHKVPKQWWPFPRVVFQTQAERFADLVRQRHGTSQLGEPDDLNGHFAN
jgi:hypothetical protein